MRTIIEPKNSYHLINHGPCNLITTGDGTLQNVAPINWTMPINTNPALMGTVIDDKIVSYKLIKASNHFVINLIGESHADQTLACGKCHGDTVNKFEKFGLTPLPSKMTKAPYLKESVAHIECEVVGFHPYSGVTLFIGKVLHAEVESECWDGKGLIPEKMKSLHHLTGGTFVVSERAVIAKRLTI